RAVSPGGRADRVTDDRGHGRNGTACPLLWCREAPCMVRRRLPPRVPAALPADVGVGTSARRLLFDLLRCDPRLTRVLRAMGGFRPTRAVAFPLAFEPRAGPGRDGVRRLERARAGPPDAA